MTNDDIAVKRPKKKDKAKRNNDLNGKYSTKAVRKYDTMQKQIKPATS
jgi:hypothetical protein